MATTSHVDRFGPPPGAPRFEMSHRHRSSFAVLDVALEGLSAGTWVLLVDRDSDALAVHSGPPDRSELFLSLACSAYAAGPSTVWVAADRVVARLHGEAVGGAAARLVAHPVCERAAAVLGWCNGATAAQAAVLLDAAPSALSAAAVALGHPPAPQEPPDLVGAFAPVHRFAELAAALAAAGWGYLDGPVAELAVRLAASGRRGAAAGDPAGWARRLVARATAVHAAASAVGVEPDVLAELVVEDLDAAGVAAVAATAFG